MKRAGLLFALLLSQLVIAPTSRSDEMRIGVVLGLTGPLAETAVAIKDGILLAQEEDVADKNPRRVTFLFEDDQFQARKTVDAVQKLLSKDGVEALVVFGSTTALSVAPIAERGKIPMIAIAVTDRVTEGRRYVFKNFIDLDEQIRVIRDEVLRRKYKSIAIVAALQDAVQDIKRGYLASPPAPVVSDIDIAPDNLDLRTTAAQIAKADPSAVFLLALGPQISQVSRQLRTLGYKGEFFGSVQIAANSDVVGSEGAMAGAWYVANDYRVDPDFLKRFERRFGHPPHHEAGNGYDVARILLEGARRSSDSESLREYLATARDIRGAMGVYSADAKNRFSVPAVVAVIPPTAKNPG